MKKDKESNKSWYFLVSVLSIFLVIIMISPATFSPIIKAFYSLLKKIIPVLILVFILMVLIAYLTNPKKIVKYFGKKSSLITWILAVVLGIISLGSIYLWYPLLKELQTHGVRNGLLVTFLYNRAIKLPLLPLFIFYFGLTYVLVLTSVMVITSVIAGYIVEKFLEFEK